MSNASVIQRIEDKLTGLQQSTVSREEFACFFNQSVEALEAIPWADVQEARRLAALSELMPDVSDDPDTPSFSEIISDIEAWLKQHKEENCQP